jgi:hypothetical protein
MEAYNTATVLFERRKEEEERHGKKREMRESECEWPSISTHIQRWCAWGHVPLRAKFLSSWEQSLAGLCRGGLVDFFERSIKSIHLLTERIDALFSSSSLISSQIFMPINVSNFAHQLCRKIMCPIKGTSHTLGRQRAGKTYSQI